MIKDDENQSRPTPPAWIKFKGVLVGGVSAMPRSSRSVDDDLRLYVISRDDWKYFLFCC